jgi:hypothetical protein
VVQIVIIFYVDTCIWGIHLVTNISIA